LLPNAFPISKTGFYNEIQAPTVKISPRGFSYDKAVGGFGDHAQKSNLMRPPLVFSALMTHLKYVNRSRP
jgi:hypothetical protein